MPDAANAPSSSVWPECPHCRAALPGACCNTPAPVKCPACGRRQRTVLFPAFFRPVDRGHVGERVEMEGDAGCFHHPGRKAVVACEGCGRFLCALCDVPMGGRHLCAGCIEAGRRKGKLANLHRHRVLYDDVALALAVYPLVIPFLGWVFVILTAPASLFVVMRYWKEPLGVVRRSRWRFVMAALLAALSLTGWVAAVVMIALG